MKYTQAYNLSTSSDSNRVIYIGRHCKIEDFFLLCVTDASVSVYITEYLTSKGADGKRITNTYYLLKDKLVFKNEQYNKFLAHFDPKTKSWISASSYPNLEFKFRNEFRLHVSCSKTNGRVDVICNITDMEKYNKNDNK